MRIPARFRKDKISFVLIFLLGWMSAGAQTQPDKEKDAIKAVIIRETSSFMNVDHKNWSDTWVQSSYAYWSYADSTGSSFIEGWDAIEKSYENYFKTQKPSKAKITDEWIEVRIYGTGAYARFIQRSADNIDVEETSQVRVLEKRDGKWKVVHVGVMARYPKKP